ncbi:MAG TPA: amidohydrolase family protein [Dehalococcoidia bacterium]|jgi:predicted TIM-barrel fold metal-dependent hydrolase
MPDFDVIDCHAHIFQNAETGIRYQTSMGRRDQPERNGTVEEVLGFMKSLGISQTIMLLYLPATDMFDRRVADLPKEPRERAEATRALREDIGGRVSRYNQWGVETGQKHPEILPFVGADPMFFTRDGLVEELEDKHKKGAKGVKIVPMAMRIYLNDPRLWPVYDFCNRTGLPLLTQSGGGFQSGDGWDAWGRPIYLRPALEEFKNLRVITAHFGRGYLDDVVELANKFDGFYTDLSSQVGDWGESGHWSIEEGVEAIRKTGVDKVVYGTNYPQSDPKRYIAKLRSLPLKESELEKIAAGNVKRVVGLS